MWGPDFNTPWHPFQPGLNSEIPTLMGLGSTTNVVALIGDRQAGPRGRFGVVGIAGQVSEITSDNSFSELQRAFDEPRHGLRVIAMGYEMGHPLVALQPQAPPLGHPKGLVIDLCGAVVFDHKTRLARVVGHEREACDLLKKNLQIGMATAPSAGTAILDPTISDEEHSRRIQVTQDHIAAGDIYQANIARRLTVSGDINALGLLSRLSQQNPVAHGAYIRTHGLEIISNTMETLLTHDPISRILRSFPIKGTSARNHRDPLSVKDRRDLEAHPKERAEHVMIVDLVRNDLGKVCEPGSIQVPELMGIHGYKGVWHGVSTVEGRLDRNVSLSEVITAVFPGGSITGAPKRRAMEIIRDIENEPRGFYTGSIALLGPNGRLSMSILIRTLVRDSRGWSLSVGGGIVSDSSPSRELAETWEKVEVFRQALAPHSV